MTRANSPPTPEHAYNLTLALTEDRNEAELVRAKMQLAETRNQ